MNAFDQAKTVEQRGLDILEPFLQRYAHNGQYVMTSKGPLARHLQETTGDAMFNSDWQRFWTVEIKVEERHTGNLFLETWSNRNLDSKQSHADRGSNPGWLLKLRAELLFYYFLDNDSLYIIDLFELQSWIFDHVGSGRVRGFRDYRETEQGKYQQANDTWGLLVPVADIHGALDRKHYRFVNPKQIELFAEIGS